MSAAESLHTSEDLESYLRGLVPDRCRRGEELCPWLAGIITTYSVSFGHLPQESQKDVAQKVIDTINSASDTCSLGVGTTPMWTGEQVSCRNGELCGGFGGNQPSLFEQNPIRHPLDDIVDL